MFDKDFERLIFILGGESLLDLKRRAESNEKDMLTFRSVFERKVSIFEKNYGQRSFTFRDERGTTVLYPYILEFHTEEDVDGTPLIVLNDFPPFIRGDKKNPVLNMVLRYKSDEDRDEDYKMLNLCRK